MHTQSRPFRLTAAIAVAGLLLAPVLPQPALAQSAPPSPQNVPSLQTGDPPTRVGRLAQVTGTVSFHTQDETQWNPASSNYPIVEGNAFWTQPNSQATIQVSASLLAMAPETELDISTLNDTAFQATLPQGEVYAHVQAASPNETYALQTPRGLVTLSSPGRYSVAAGDTQSPTLVTVVEGSAHITSPGVDLDVAANQTATLNGTDTFQAQVGPGQRDPFLTAMLAREQPRPPQPQSVAPPPAVAAMPGGDDLAQYGTWSDNSQYGQVWYPQVQSGWVPYRDGHWAYVAPWGWTWVDSDPWGFAPFHYGRWADIDGRWGWVPGTAVASYAGPPVYAPALVTFFGVAAGVAVGVGIGAALAGGNIGWCPLGPREVYRPWYNASPNYMRNVNITHVTNVTNITTINRNVTINNFANRGAATFVPASAMAASRPVSGFAQRPTPSELAQARPVFGTQPVRPTAATAGVTPAVARQFNLATPTPGTRPAAPGPAIHAVPAVVRPGAAAPNAAVPAAAGHPQLPPLHNPTQGVTPAVVGAHPATTTPALREPAAPGHAGPPLIENGLNARTPGAEQAPAGTTNGARTPEPAGHAGLPPVQNSPNAVAPAGAGRVPLVTNPGGVANPAAITHQPPIETHAAPGTAQPPAAAAATPPGLGHGGPVPGSPANPAVIAHQPPVETHAARPPAVQAEPVNHAPPPVMHAAPSAPVQVHAAPPPEANHPSPSPQLHTAPPPSPAAVHAPPPPAAHAAPVAVHAAPPSPVHAAPPPPAAHPAPAQAQNNQHKKPGEP